MEKVFMAHYSIQNVDFIVLEKDFQPKKCFKELKY